MHRYDRPARLLAASLAGLAGYVDAIGFLGSGGFFVSFMSGNSTRLGIGLVDNRAAMTAALALIGAFVAGVTTSSLVKRRTTDRSREPAVLATTATGLTAAAVTGPFAPLTGFALTAFAMGAINLLFEEEGEVRIGLTYMTGTLVKIGHRIADALSGGPRLGWLPHLTLWAALLAGGGAGAKVYALFGLGAIWPAAALAWLLTAYLVIRAGRTDRSAATDIA